MTWDEVKAEANRLGFVFIFTDGPEGRKWYRLEDTSPEWPLTGSTNRYEWHTEPDPDSGMAFISKIHTGPAMNGGCWELSTRKALGL